MLRNGIVLAAVASIACAAGLLLAPRARSDDAPTSPDLWLRVGTLHVGDGRVQHDMTLRLSGGLIVSVGQDVPPDGADVRDFPAAHMTPGWIDAITQLGVGGGAVERADVLTPGVRAADAFDPESRALEGLSRTGVTSFGVLPSPGNVAAGRAGWCGLTGRGVRVAEGSGAAVFALQSPAIEPNRVPSTLSGARQLLEHALRGVRWSTPAESALPIRDVALARLSTLDGGPALVYVDTPEAARVARDVLAAKRLRITLVGLGDALDDPEGVAALGLPCVITSLGPDDAARRLAFPARLAAAGAQVAISTGAPSKSVRSLRLALALAVANGLPTDRAVPAVTSLAARALGAEDRIGTVAVGREADLVVFAGEPWEPSSRLLLVIADGQVVYDGHNSE